MKGCSIPATLSKKLVTAVKAAFDKTSAISEKVFPAERKKFLKVLSVLIRVSISLLTG